MFGELREIGIEVVKLLAVVHMVAGTGKAFVSKETPIEKWFKLESMVAQDIDFKVEFAVPKNFGVPGAIIVKNEHPNEFLLVAFNLTLPDQSEAHYITNSWVYKTGSEGRIFFLNKVCTFQTNAKGTSSTCC